MNIYEEDGLKELLDEKISAWASKLANDIDNEIIKMYMREYDFIIFVKNFCNIEKFSDYDRF